MTETNEAARAIKAIVDAPSSGIYARDCELGRQLGSDAVDRMRASNFPGSLSYIVQALTEAGRYNAVHIGFFHQIAEAALKG